MRAHDIITERSQAQRKHLAGVKSDQFFTRTQVAQDFADWVKSQPFYSAVERIIEPAAGAQDLARHFPGIETYDLKPMSADIVQQDFLTSQHQQGPRTLVVMNPPFGPRSSLALAFFNHAATFADYIAQIVPRTFRRPSVQGRLDQQWHLVDERMLPRNSFYLPAEGPERGYNVPAVAQIWQRRDTARPQVPEHTMPNDVHFVRAAEADMAFRRKGRRAGDVVTQGIEHTNPNSFFYIKTTPERIRQFQTIPWREYGNDVMGARSISQADIARALNR
jgi:hypothetical protein